MRDCPKILVERYFINFLRMRALVLQHIKANQLPHVWAKRLRALPSQKFTIKIELEGEKHTNPLFGIWQDHAASENVENYIDSLRRSRTC